MTIKESKTVVITGGDGLLGRHIRYRLHALHQEWRVISLNRQQFNDNAALRDALSEADIVIHCAGINRDDDTSLEQGNRALARRLLDVMRMCGSIPYLCYANTTQRHVDSAYGRGKSAAHRLFHEWSLCAKAEYCELVLPHIFGEGGRPYYNSAISTFCHQLARGEALTINGQGQLELVHAQDVAAEIINAMEKRYAGTLRIKGRVISVAAAAGKLVDMHTSYKGKVIPDLRDCLDLQLFNTLRSYMFPHFYPSTVAVHSDDRGGLYEAVKSHNGGQVFLSTTNPGVTRGNHFHINKVERFLVVKGSATIRLRRIFDDHVVEFNVSGDSPCYIDMPTFHTHSITNTGEGELLTLFWSHELFDVNNPDTFYETVIVGEE